ncbi:uncharacterized protein METZ01_LOCUS303577 [marine metagenome]|uniref:Uncharacterized protein n=1 Tax=marine metagenome TaxID=408172 RepID=A0A382MP05_9ZZZZ
MVLHNSNLSHNRSKKGGLLVLLSGSSEGKMIGYRCFGVLFFLECVLQTQACIWSVSFYPRGLAVFHNIISMPDVGINGAGESTACCRNDKEMRICLAVKNQPGFFTRRKQFILNNRGKGISVF